MHVEVDIVDKESFSNGGVSILVGIYVKPKVKSELCPFSSNFDLLNLLWLEVASIIDDDGLLISNDAAEVPVSLLLE